jgi:hypothetical protein
LRTAYSIHHVGRALRGFSRVFSRAFAELCMEVRVGLYIEVRAELCRAFVELSLSFRRAFAELQ